MLDLHTARHRRPRALAATWPCEAGEEWDSGQATWANCGLCLLDYLGQATSPLESQFAHLSVGVARVTVPVVKKAWC